MKNPKLNTILKIVCYVLSFPLFLVFAIIASSNVLKAGSGYGLLPWAGLLVAILFSVIWAVIVLVFELKIKKSNNKKALVKKQTRKLAIASFALLAGLMLILDIALPPLLPGPTSYTIFYEDLADDSNGRADLNKDLLNEFIARSVTVGNLGSVPLVINADGTDNLNAVNAEILKYQELGMNDANVKNLLERTGSTCEFVSFNLSGYETFIGPWLDMANDSRMTIPCIVNLIIAQRNPIASSETPGNSKWENDKKVLQSEWHDFYQYNPETNKVEAIKYQWTILDMMGAPIVLDLSDTIGEDGLEEFIMDLLRSQMVDGAFIIDAGPLGEITFADENGIVTMNGAPLTDILENGGPLAALGIFPYELIDSLLDTIAETLADPAIAGAPITLKIVDSEGNTDNFVVSDENGEPIVDEYGDTTIIRRSNINKDGTALSVEPNNENRGVLDYQSQAWLDSNGLVFAICSLMSIRKVCYIFSGICVLLALLCGYFREKEVDSCSNLTTLDEDF